MLIDLFLSLKRRAADNVRMKHQYQEVLRNLVKRYVAALIRDAKTEEGLKEENFKELKQDISSFRYEVVGMMRRPNGRASNKVACSPLAYPGNPFKYSPKFLDESQQKLNIFDMISPTADQSEAASTTDPVGSHRLTNGSVVLSSTEKTSSKSPKGSLKAGSLQRQKQHPPTKGEDINLLPAEGIPSVSSGDDLRKLVTQKVIVKVLQDVDDDVQKTKNKPQAKDVKNRPKKYKN